MTRRNHSHRVIPAMAEAREQNAAIDSTMLEMRDASSFVLSPADAERAKLVAIKLCAERVKTHSAGEAWDRYQAELRTIDALAGKAVA